MDFFDRSTQTNSFVKLIVKKRKFKNVILKIKKKKHKKS